MNSDRLRKVILTAILAALAGCGTQRQTAKRLYEEPAHFDYQDEVGFSKISVISVAPWQEVEPSLLPDFKLDSETALKKVAASGVSEDESFLNSLSAALSLTLPGGSAGGNSSGGKSGGATSGGSSSDSSGGSSKSSSGGKPSSDGGSGKQASAPALAPVSAISDYTLAYSLFQEVQLLNSYVKHVTKEEDEKAYLVTMDVGLFPSRKAAVDALIVISFVANDRKSNGEVTHWMPRVIPVILSEDVEINRHSRQAQENLQLALKVAGAIHGIGVAGSASSLADALGKAAGNDVNTLQLVANASQTALAVRFGASYGVETKYALTPQVRRIHCLLLVPKEQHGNLFAVAHTLFNPVDGTEIRTRPQSKVWQKNTDEFQQQTGLQISEDDMKQELWADYNLNDQEAFDRYWRAKDERAKGGLGAKAVPVAWAEMARLSLRSRWTFSLIRLPQRPPSDNEEQYLVYAGLDDTKALKIRIPGKGLPTEVGSWKLGIPAIAAMPELQLLPDTITPISDDAVELAFPSMLADKPAGATIPALKLVRLNQEGEEPPEIGYSVKVVKAKAKDDKPKSVVQILNTQVAAESDGSGECVVEIASGKVKTLTLDGSSATLQVNGKAVATLSYDTKSGKRLVVALKHLVPGWQVTLVARDAKDKELGRASVPVIAGGQTPKPPAAKPTTG